MRKAGLFIISLLTLGCGKGHTPAPAVAAKDPAKASLLLPAANQACTTGTVISDTQSTIEFSWDKADNADGYELHIKDLVQGTITTQTTTSTDVNVALSRNTPYLWYVVSKSSSSSKTAQSDTWKFYNAGAGIVHYAPFSATLLTPGFAQSVAATNGTVKLTWQGSAVENNITAYDIYFDTRNDPALVKSAVPTSSYDATVKSGTTYYWKIVTKDTNGNSTTSDVFQFSVQ